MCLLAAGGGVSHFQILRGSALKPRFQNRDSFRKDENLKNGGNPDFNQTTHHPATLIIKDDDDNWQARFNRNSMKLGRLFQYINKRICNILKHCLFNILVISRFLFEIPNRDSWSRFSSRTLFTIFEWRRLTRQSLDAFWRQSYKKKFCPKKTTSKLVLNYFMVGCFN